MHKRLGGLPDTAWVGGLQRRGGRGRGEGIKEEGRFLNKGHMILLAGHDSILLRDCEENMRNL